MSTTTPNLPELLKADEVARALRVSPQRVTQLVREGKLSAVRIGERGKYRFRVADVERLLTAGEVTAP